MLTQIRKLDPTFPAFFRFREVEGRVVLTSLEGNFLILTKDEFSKFASGEVPKESELYKRLKEGNFVRAEFDQPKAVERLRARKSFVHFGPNLHVIVVTLRCNETCVYCHASRADMDAVHTDMSKETAEKTVDFILKSSNPSVTIEFQGGEPLVNFPVVQHIIEYALEQNKRVGKQLEFTMVSNLSLMDEAKLAVLLKYKVQICTSIDGPEHIHDKQRKLPGLSAHKAATFWIARINKAYEEIGLDPSLYHVEALLTDDGRDPAALEGRGRHVCGPGAVGRCSSARSTRSVSRNGPGRGSSIRAPSTWRSIATPWSTCSSSISRACRSSSGSPRSFSPRSSVAKIRTSSICAVRAVRASVRSPTTTTARSSPATKVGCCTRWATALFSSATSVPPRSATWPGTTRSARW